MAIALVGIGAAVYTSAATDVNVATPAGTLPEHRCVLVVHVKEYTINLAVNPPAGWTAPSPSSGTGGTTAVGIDVGSVKTMLFYRDGVTGAVNTLIDIPSIGSTGLLGAQVLAFSKAASETWDTVTTTFGGDGTHGSNYSATGAAGLNVAAGDMIVAGTGASTDAGTLSAIAIGGMAGATLGAQVLDNNEVTVTGGDGRTVIQHAPVTAGSSNAAPTFTYTNANASQGCTGFMRLRVIAGAASGNSVGSLSFFGYAGGPPLRNFFAGADGTTITSANSDDISGHQLSVTLTSIGLTYETDRALTGPSCAKVTDAAGTGGAPNGSTAVLIYGATPWAVLEAAAEVWVYIPTGSTWNTAGDVLAIRNASGNIAKVQINASRVAFVSDAAGAVSGGSAPTAIPFDTWYRIALWCKVGETTATGRISARVGAAFDAPSWTMTPVTNANTGTTPITNARAGKLTTTHTPPIFYLGGFNAGPGHTTFIADPVLPTTGSAVGAIAWVGTGSGKRTPKGSSTTGAVSWVGSASGDTPPNRGSSTGAVAWVGAGSGSRPVVPPKTGSAAGAVAWAGSGSGRKATSGSAVGAFTFTGAGSGKRAPKAASSGAFTFAGTASGTAPVVPPKSGSAAGSIAWAGTAAGRRVARGAATGLITWAGSAAGDAPSNRGSSAGAYTLAGTGTGGRASKGAADGAVTWLAVAAGTRHPAGTAVGGFTFTGSAAGFAPEVGVSQGVSSGHVQWTGAATGGAGAGGGAAGDVLWAGTAAGARAAYAQALGAIAWLGSGSGARRPLGDVRAAITWAGLAAGFAPQVGVSQGVSSGALSWFGLATGKRKAKGSSMTEINWAAVAAGLRNASATSEGELSWMGHASGARDPEDSLPVPTLVDAMRPIVIALEANGIRCTADYKFLNPPCCYLPPPDLDFRFRQGDFTANYSLVLIAANTTRRLALEEMAQLLVVVQRVLNDRAVHAIPEDVPTNDGSAVLLAYRLTWSERIRRRPAPQVAAAR